MKLPVVFWKLVAGGLVSNFGAVGENLNKALQHLEVETVGQDLVFQKLQIATVTM
jgi:hypothetical protein